MILVKNLNFLHSLFLLKIGLEMMFKELLDRKEALVDHKKCIAYTVVEKSESFQRG